jgi:hypothetical protein
MIAKTTAASLFGTAVFFKAALGPKIAEAQGIMYKHTKHTHKVA